MSLIPRNYFGDIFDDFMPMTKEENMKCDIYEKDGDYHIEMDVPGFSKDEIKIEAKKDYLTIIAEKQVKKKMTMNKKTIFIAKEAMESIKDLSTYMI